MAHFGYLHSIRIFFRYGNSSLSSWWLEHIALALCVRPLITLYLQARLWWLSHCRYKSVQMGFLYILLVRIPFLCGVISVFRNGMESSGLFSSTGNMVGGSTELMCCKNSSLFDCCCMTKVSYTYGFQILEGFTAVVMDMCSIDPICKLATIGLTGAAPIVCLKIDHGTRTRCCINRILAALWCCWLTWLSHYSHLHIAKILDHLNSYMHLHIKKREDYYYFQWQRSPIIFIWCKRFDHTKLYKKFKYTEAPG